MALDLGGLFDTLRLMADWPSGSKDHGPARKRVGRFSFWAFVAIVGLTAIGIAVIWLRSPDFAAFDRDALPVGALGVLALVVLLVAHLVAVAIAHTVDRRAKGS